MNGLKTVRLFLVLALAMTVGSQPLEAIVTSGGASLSTQLLNWAQVGFEAFLEWAKQGFGLSTDEENTTTNRILLVTGLEKETELWPKPDSQCALSYFPLIEGAVGFWTAQGPTVCGGLDYEVGRTQNKCFLYKEHQWLPWTNMGTARRYASAIQINPNQALIIGGWDENDNRLKTTELYSSSGSKEGKDFPVTIWGHCSFPFNATHAIVTGGTQETSYGAYANTWFVDLTTTTFTPGPTMKTERGWHGCSIFQSGNKSFGIVAGGYNWNGYLDSTEVIDLDQESPTWTEGPKLPRKLDSLTLVETSQGTYAMGGRAYGRSRNEVLQLDCLGDQISSCQWNQVGNLQFARNDHVAIALPESYDICN